MTKEKLVSRGYIVPMSIFLTSRFICAWLLKYISRAKLPMLFAFGGIIAIPLHYFHTRDGWVVLPDRHFSFYVIDVSSDLWYRVRRIGDWVMMQN